MATSTGAYPTMSSVCDGCPGMRGIFSFQTEICDMLPEEDTELTFGWTVLGLGSLAAAQLNLDAAAHLTDCKNLNKDFSNLPQDAPKIGTPEREEYLMKCPAMKLIRDVG